MLNFKQIDRLTKTVEVKYVHNNQVEIYFHLKIINKTRVLMLTDSKIYIFKYLFSKYCSDASSKYKMPRYFEIKCIPRN